MLFSSSPSLNNNHATIVSIVAVQSGVNLATIAQQSQLRQSPLMTRKSSRPTTNNSPMGQFFNQISPSKSVSMSVDDEEAGDFPDASVRVNMSRKVVTSPFPSMSARSTPTRPSSGKPPSARRPSAFSLICSPEEEAAAKAEAEASAAAGTSRAGAGAGAAEGTTSTASGERTVSSIVESATNTPRGSRRSSFAHGGADELQVDEDEAYDHFSETESLAPSEFSAYSGASRSVTGGSTVRSARSTTSASSGTSKASSSDHPVSNHELIVASVDHPDVLIGWRVLIKGYGAGTIMNMKRQKFKATKFSIQLETGQSVMLPLKRSAKKGTVPFSPIAKVC